MVEITKRCVGMIDRICAEKNPVTARELADEFHVSERTVRNDIALAKRWLAERGVELCARPRVGFSFSDDERPIVDGLIAPFRETKYSEGRYLNADERALTLVGEILSGVRVSQFDEVQERLGVSRSTYARDLDRAVSWFSSHGVDLTRGGKQGVQLVIKESVWRKLAVDFLIENINGTQLLTFIMLCDFSNASIPSLSNLSFVNEMLDAEALGSIVDEVDRCLDGAGITLRDDDYVWLLCYFAVMIHRVRDGSHLDEPEVGRYDYTSSTIYDVMMGSLAKRLGSYVTERQLKTETDFIVHRIMSLTRLAEPDDISPNRASAESICGYVVNAVRQNLGFELGEDEELLNQLKMHIQAALVRMQMRHEAKNPMLEQAKEQFPQYIEVCRRAFEAVRWATGIEFTEDEVAYIAMYIAVFAERRRDAMSRIGEVRAVLICGHGAGTVTFLKESLKREFPSIDILDTLSVFEATSYDYLSVDLVLTTIDVPVPLSRPLIKVHPILTRLDIRRIGAFLKMAPIEPQPCDSVRMDELMRVISRHCNILDRDGLRESLSELVDNDDAGIIELVELPSLVDVVKRRCTDVHVEARTWDDAVRIAADKLVENGCATETFLEDVVRMRDEYGQYSVLPGGICLPHAFPNPDFELAMTLVTLDRPVTVDFSGSPMTFSCVMAISTPKTELQSKALDQLFCLLDEHPGLVADLCGTSFPSELYRKFRGYCQRL